MTVIIAIHGYKYTSANVSSFLLFKIWQPYIIIIINSIKCNISQNRNIILTSLVYRNLLKVYLFTLIT